MGSHRVLGPLAAVAVLLAACGGAGTPAPSASASPSASAVASQGTGGICQVAEPGTVAAAQVTIRDFAFGPATVTIKAGQAVAWTNADSTSHTATTLDGGCNTKPISKGATVTLVFPTAGTYRYHCTIHSTMPTATVEVTD